MASFYSRIWTILLFTTYLIGSSLLTVCRHASDAVSDIRRPLQQAMGVLPVRIVQKADGFELLRGGQPYLIKGAAGVQYLNLIREKGGNSVRIYTPKYADVLLDEAQRQGLTVMFGLWMKPPYEKFDYYDPKAVKAQQEEVYQQVLRYKNHPALLMWNLGNELDNHTKDFKVYQIVNETARMIHKLDPNHPVTTTVTDGTYYIPAIVRLCPDIDVLTVNVFAQMPRQLKRLSDAGWHGPVIIGEFGGRGWWEASRTTWGAPLDQSGSMKADSVRLNYEATFAGKHTRCLGSYVLYWGNRFEQTNMWLSLFAPTGEKTPMVDMVQYLWTGHKPENEAPHVGKIRLANKLDNSNVLLKPSTDYPIAISVSDPDGDSLRVQWTITRDVNEFHRLPQNRMPPETITGAIRKAARFEALVRTPLEEGAYRLLANVYDDKGSVTSNSFPFYVGTPN